MRLVLEIRSPPNFNFHPSNMSLQTSVSLLRPFPASPSRNLSKHKSSHRIRFLHPGYSDDHNLLLNLSAFDTLGPPHGGIHYGTAFLACAIVAGNSWSGYLTESTRDGNRVKHQVDAILRNEQYYFHVPIPEDQSSLPAPIRFSFADSSYHKYPVCPSFRNWKFPHRDLPPFWLAHDMIPDAGGDTNDGDLSDIPPPTSNITLAVLRRDRSCRLSNSKDYVECAHLCPDTETNWFNGQAMASYNTNSQLLIDNSVNDAANAIALRADIHSAFDDHSFVFVRKFGVWVAHFLKPTNELGPCYHNTRIGFHREVSPAFLLSRFAYSIFPYLSSFLSPTAKKLLRFRDENGIEMIKELGGDDLRIVMTKTRGRSESLKRRRTEDDQETQQRRRCRISSADSSSTHC